jgi:hypothetical protein
LVMGMVGNWVSEILFRTTNSLGLILFSLCFFD